MNTPFLIVNHTQSNSSMKFRVPIVLLSLAVTVRWLVAQFPHSGQSNAPTHGDYEAQRHWMEVTTNLKASDWYKNTTNNDLLYWGLDYPPLTAYHMQALGIVANNINSSWTELHKSRGEKSRKHKLFMRLSVLVPDVLIYMLGFVYFFNKSKVYLFFALMYPAQILIDHGHFQYNCVFMGLVLWSVISMTKGRQMIAAFFFTLALNYKQMALYYALPFFWYLFSVNIRRKPFWKGILHILAIGIIVISTTATCFAPYLSSAESVYQVIQRLFPFYRGLFEDKVANIWFSLSIFIKFKALYSIDYLVKLSLASTLLASLPSGIHLLISPSIRNFNYALVNTSLAFFLLSFQVHEKTILVPALPILLLYREHPRTVHWFSIISTFSLHPLLFKDGQSLPYFTLMMTQLILCSHSLKNEIRHRRLCFSFEDFFIALYLFSTNCCIFLSSLSYIVDPPARYPDAYAVINALYSCAHFVCFYLYFSYQQFKPRPVSEESLQKKKTK